jgi:hypothetical protein
VEIRSALEQKLELTPEPNRGKTPQKNIAARRPMKDYKKWKGKTKRKPDPTGSGFFPKIIVREGEC